MMKLTILRISEPTSSGNVLISLGERIVEHVKGLGDIVSRKTRFLVAVSASSVQGKVGDIVDINESAYEVRETSWVDDEGNECHSTWLVPKRGK